MMSSAKPELIVLLDEQGQPIGTAEKLASHHANTPLHLAFSCYVFNDAGQFLLTQRALSKKVWPGVWTNSVCGHPAPGEDIPVAIERRLREELSMQATDFQVVLPEYRYKTPPFEGIVENEICPVYVARATSQPQPNPAEVERFEWLDWAEYVQRVTSAAPNTFSWWCADQLKQLKDNEVIKRYAKVSTVA
jgi:isopentenyl-diphosphate delta-isomerase